MYDDWKESVSQLHYIHTRFNWSSMYSSTKDININQNKKIIQGKLCKIELYILLFDSKSVIANGI